MEATNTLFINYKQSEISDRLNGDYPLDVDLDEVKEEAIIQYFEDIKDHIQYNEMDERDALDLDIQRGFKVYPIIKLSNLLEIKNYENSKDVFQDEINTEEIDIKEFYKNPKAQKIEDDINKAIVEIFKKHGVDPSMLILQPEGSRTIDVKEILKGDDE